MKVKEIINRFIFKGRNFSRFLSLCLENELNLINIDKNKDGDVLFSLNDKDCSKLKKLNTSSFILKQIKIGGFKGFMNIIIFRIGLIIGISLALICGVLLNNRLLQIHISGINNYKREEIIDFINNFGIDTFSNLNFNKELLEKELSENFNFSLVSIVTKGNSLIINVKEEIPDISSSYAPITADYNMLIKNIEVYSGTPSAISGQVVYKGDTLVEPHIEKDGKRIFVTPCAKIEAEIFFTEAYVFENSQQIIIRTGEKTLIDSSINLSLWNILKTSKDIPYVIYELVTEEINVSNYLIPLKIKKTYAYEIKNSIVDRDFQVEKDNIINDLQKKVHDQIPSHIVIDEEEVITTEINNGYIINYFARSNMIFNYN